MTSLQDKLARLDRGRAQIESLVVAGVDLKSDPAIAIELEIIHAFEDLAQEFSYKVRGREIP